VGHAGVDPWFDGAEGGQVRFLIDGYNLAVCSGLVHTLDGPGNPQRARQRVMAWLAACLGPDEQPRATIVFDARTRPSQPDVFGSHQFRVLFAVDHDEADALLEELIQLDSAPRNLTVVSSDRRLRAAAKRRRCVWISSQDWFDQMQRRSTLPPVADPPAKPETIEDREKLIKEFDTPEIRKAIRNDSIQRLSRQKQRRRRNG
jgi:predicted RNA-binding protein with PIN domain